MRNYFFYKKLKKLISKGDMIFLWKSPFSLNYQFQINGYTIYKKDKMIKI